MHAIQDAPTKPEPDAERRIMPRLRLPAMLTNVTARPRRGASSTDLNGHAYDISQTGVRIELDEALEVGESVDLTVELPWAGPRIDVLAQVVWVNDEADDPGPRRMALQFDPDTPSPMKLAQFIEASRMRAAA